jgi:hypothetical protein
MPGCTSTTCEASVVNLISTCPKVALGISVLTSPSNLKRKKSPKRSSRSTKMNASMDFLFQCPYRGRR